MKKVCAVYDVSRTDQVILTVKNKILDFSQRDLQHIYHAAPFKFNEELKRLLHYLKLLERQRMQILLGYEPCLCDADMQGLYERITKITGLYCVNQADDVLVDESNEEIWALKNPQCRSYKEWEKLSKTVCSAINLDIRLEKTQCDITFDISTGSVSCDVLLAASAYKKACDVGLKLTRSQDEHKIDFKLLTEKVPNCDLDLGTYLRLVNNNVSFDIISCVYEAGLSLNVTKKEVALKTPIAVYPFGEIGSEIDVAYLQKFGLRPTKTISDLLQDYK